MYEKYFQLRERPFALSPDPEYLYPSRVHQEALSYLRYGIEGHAGFVVITGEIGSGKTTMLQSLLGQLDKSTAVARIVNTLLDPRELLESIMLDFGMDPTGMSKPVLLHKLAAFLVQQRQASRLTLLIIDEAQNLGLPALEEIRMLSNLETEKSKLLQIVLIGQPELRETLSLPKLEQLRQRITVSYHLPPLDVAETANYINHRLKRAALGAPMEFPRIVTDLIHSRSRGVPRIINVIADATLLFAYGVDRRTIDVSITQEAIAELDSSGVLTSYRPAGGAEPAADGGQHGATVQGDRDGTTAGATVQGDQDGTTAGATVRGDEGATVSVRPEGAGVAVATSPAPKPATARPNPPAPNRILAPTQSAIGLNQNPVAPTLAPSHARTIAPSTVRRPPPPVARAGAPMHSSVAVLPNGVRVQRFAHVAVENPGWWDRLRRAVFGVFETGA